MDIALSEQSKMGQTEHVLTLLLDCDVHQIKIQNIPFLGHPICPRIIFCPPANTKNVQVLCIIQLQIQIQIVSKCWVSFDYKNTNTKSVQVLGIWKCITFK